MSGVVATEFEHTRTHHIHSARAENKVTKLSFEKRERLRADPRDKRVQLASNMATPSVNAQGMPTRRH